MTYFHPILFLLFTLTSFAQQPYYTNGQNNVDFTLTGENLFDALQLKISNNTNAATYTYGDVRDDFEIMDIDPSNSNNVLLLYGFTNTISCTDGVTDRRIRDKDDFGGDNCEYNREHIFARSNANPGMGSTNNSFTGIVADPHNLRACDVQRNGTRGSKKFGAGSGNSSDVGSGYWYPGDEWIGDVARTMMYMYVRYGDRCLPDLNGFGPKEGTTEMLQIYLEWNALDPVSAIENNRNNHLELVYGNRNPFIDNPYLAKSIWGGDEEPADIWGILNITDVVASNFKITPNPTKDVVNITLPNNEETRLEIYTILGKRVYVRKVNTAISINISSLKTGLYIFKFVQKNKTVTKKLVVR